MNFSELQISELGQIVTGKTPSTKNRAFFDGPYQFVTPSDISFKHYYCRKTETTVTEEAKEKYKKQFIPANSVMFTCIGNTIGKCALSSEPCLTNQQINTIISFPDFDPRFVYYLMIYNAEIVRGIGLGGGSATPIINKTAFSRIKVKVPPKPIRDSIANILSAYDDLIENNRRRIALLERAARLLYKEWFVHLRFPGHEHVKIIDGVPEGWEKKRVEELLKKHIGGGWGQDEPLGNEINPAYVIRGADIPSVISGEFDAVKLRYHKESALKSRLLEEGDIIFEVSGGSATQPVGRALRISKKILEQFKGALICASFCKRLKPKTGLLSAYLYYHIKHIRENGEMQVFQKQSASALQNFNFEAFLEHHCVLVPSSSLLEQFSEQVALFDEQAATLALQISSLRRARDLLLPRLMNGEIAV